MVKIDETKCIMCGQCADICIMKDIEKKDGKYVGIGVNCMECGQCLAICPKNAITLPGYEDAILEYDKEKFSIDENRLLNFIKFRRSIRRYKKEKVSRDKITKLIEAGRFSPSACNAQDVEYIIVDEELKTIQEKLWDSLYRFASKTENQGLIDRYQAYKENPDAPDTLLYGGSQMLIILSGTPLNGGIASANIELMASAMGIGVLYCGFAEMAILADKELKQYFGIGNGKHLVSCMVIGYPEITFKRTVPRKPAKIEWK